MREVTSAYIFNRIKAEKEKGGVSELDDLSVGTVLFVHDFDGKKTRLKKVKLYDLSSKNQKHVIPVGTTRICDLVPRISNFRIDPCAPEETVLGYVYSENGNVFYYAYEKTWLDPEIKTDGTKVLRVFGPNMKLPWFPGEHEGSAIGICFDNIINDTKYKLFFVPKDLEDLIGKSRKGGK
jgi:hypothetical protein